MRACKRRRGGPNEEAQLLGREIGQITLVRRAPATDFLATVVLEFRENASWRVAATKSLISRSHRRIPDVRRSPRAAQ